MTKVGTTSWTDSEIEFHKREWEAGVAPHVIADQMTSLFHRDITRNAVLGRAWRQGMSKSRHTTKAKTKVRWMAEQDEMIRREYTSGRKLSWIADQFYFRFGIRTDRFQIRKRLTVLRVYKAGGFKRPKPEPALHTYGRPVGGPATPPQMIDIIEAVPPTSVPTAQLEPGMCKWPTNKSATAACGAPISMGAYCPRHAEMAYRVPPTPCRHALFNRRNQYD